jgi:hypothetical protein
LAQKGDSMNDNEVQTPHTWAELLEWRKDFPAIVHRWLKVIDRLIVYTKIQDDDELGDLIVGFMVSSRMDVTDLMTLSHADSHHGSQYCLRALFERTVTLKYLNQNPEQVAAFKEYDAVDWDQILKGVSDLTGMTVGEPAQANIGTKAREARKENKQEKCPVCNNQRPPSWTTLDTKNMASKVGLGHMYFDGFLRPTKLMHTTLWGTRERVNRRIPLVNTLKCLHELMIETIMAHRRHFVGKQYVTPIMGNAVLDFLSIWVFSDTSFDGVLTRGEERDGKRIYYGF